MKPKHQFISILAILVVFPLMGTFAQQAPDSLTIQVITTFDYPGSGNSTIPEGINDRGDITGLYTDLNGITRGFVRFHSGAFSAPIVEPNDVGVLTEGRGINHSRVVTGFYSGSDGFSHGYFLNGGTFTEFNFSGANDTLCEGLNDAGDFVGAFDSNTQGTTAFKNLGGTTTTIVVPGASTSYAFGINRSRESTGQYTDNTGGVHGWYQDSTGTIIAPFDPPGATQTLPFGINNLTFIVGRYTDSGTGLETGFLFNSRKGSYVTFEYPGAVFTSLNGVNTNGLICGRYDDGSGLLHGILARVVTGP
jgi:hypothetical protein